MTALSMRGHHCKVASGSFAAALLLVLPAVASAQNKCAAGKLKCAATSLSALLKCHAVAEKKGTPVDPVCLQKARAKLINETAPEKGCFEKLEAKGGCLTTDDAPLVASWSGAFLEEVVRQIAPSSPTPVRNACSAAKKLCVAKKLKALIACERNAVSKGSAISPACVAKAKAKFEDPAKGCFAKAEAKPPCLSTGGAAALEAIVDSLVFEIGPMLSATPNGHPVALGELTVGGVAVERSITVVLAATSAQGFANAVMDADGDGLVDPSSDDWVVRNVPVAPRGDGRPTRLSFPLPTGERGGPTQEVYAGISTTAVLAPELAQLEHAELMYDTVDVSDHMCSEDGYSCGPSSSSAIKQRSQGSMWTIRVLLSGMELSFVSQAEAQVPHCRQRRLLNVKQAPKGCAPAAALSAMYELLNRCGAGSSAPPLGDMERQLATAMDFDPARGTPIADVGTGIKAGMAQLGFDVELESSASAGMPIIDFILSRFDAGDAVVLNLTPPAGTQFSRHTVAVEGYCQEQGVVYLNVKDSWNGDTDTVQALGGVLRGGHDWGIETAFTYSCPCVNINGCWSGTFWNSSAGTSGTLTECFTQEGGTFTATFSSVDSVSGPLTGSTSGTISCDGHISWGGVGASVQGNCIDEAGYGCVEAGCYTAQIHICR